MLSSYLYPQRSWSWHEARAWWWVILDVTLKISFGLWSSMAGGLMIGCASADVDGDRMISQLSSAAVVCSRSPLFWLHDWSIFNMHTMPSVILCKITTNFPPCCSSIVYSNWWEWIICRWDDAAAVEFQHQWYSCLSCYVGCHHCHCYAVTPILYLGIYSFLANDDTPSFRKGVRLVAMVAEVVVMEDPVMDFPPPPTQQGSRSHQMNKSTRIG